MGSELETYDYLAERQFPKQIPSYLMCTCVVHLLNTILWNLLLCRLHHTLALGS